MVAMGSTMLPSRHGTESIDDRISGSVGPLGWRPSGILRGDRDQGVESRRVPQGHQDHQLEAAGEGRSTRLGGATRVQASGGGALDFEWASDPAQVPHVGGLYAFFDSAMRVIYFGKATNLYKELRQTWQRRVSAVRPWSNHKVQFKDVAAYVSAYEITRADSKFRHDTEALVLRILVNNTFNNNRGKFIRKI